MAEMVNRSPHGYATPQAGTFWLATPIQTIPLQQSHDFLKLTLIFPSAPRRYPTLPKWQTPRLHKYLISIKILYKKFRVPYIYNILAYSNTQPRFKFYYNITHRHAAAPHGRLTLTSC
jgi:hypothetical protein